MNANTQNTGAETKRTYTVEEIAKLLQSGRVSQQQLNQAQQMAQQFMGMFKR